MQKWKVPGIVFLDGVLVHILSLIFVRVGREIDNLDWRRSASCFSKHTAVGARPRFRVIAQSRTLDGDFSIATLWSLGMLA